MQRFSPTRKKGIVSGFFRLLLPVLPVAAVFALLGGCGSGNGTSSAPPNYIIPSGLLPSASASPTPFPTAFPFPTPSPSSTPTPTPSAAAPAQIVSGALRIEEATGNVVVTPFTPTTGSAEFASFVSANLVSAEFMFETNEPFTSATGRTLTNRRVVVSVPNSTKAGTTIKLGTDTTRYSVEYRETLNVGQFTGLEYNYRTPTGQDAGTITLVSIVNDVYTFDVDALLTPFASSNTGSFRLRGTVSVYAPKPADPFGGSVPINNY